MPTVLPAMNIAYHRTAATPPLVLEENSTQDLFITSGSISSYLSSSPKYTHSTSCSENSGYTPRTTCVTPTFSLNSSSSLKSFCGSSNFNRHKSFLKKRLRDTFSNPEELTSKSSTKKLKPFNAKSSIPMSCESPTKSLSYDQIGQEWVCDVWVCELCHNATFDSYEEALSHERHCSGAHHASTTENKTNLSICTFLSKRLDLCAESQYKIVQGGKFDISRVPPSPSLSSTAMLGPKTEVTRTGEECLSFRFKGSIALATPEDENWLSEKLCFIRAECLEVFCATADDVTSRMNTKRITLHQVGIRCVFCSKIPHKDRANRSACYPSSLSRIYQSLTMVMRDHFKNCKETPFDVKERLTSLKEESSKGASDSRRFWVDSSRKQGMIDTPNGIRFERDPTLSLATEPIPVSSGDVVVSRENLDVVLPEDENLVSEYLHLLMQQVQRCQLTEVERVGAHKKLAVGFTGLACKHCSSCGGLGRLYPLHARSLWDKVKNIHNHLMRCTGCHPSVKKSLQILHSNYVEPENDKTTKQLQKLFFDLIWKRLHNDCSGNSIATGAR